MGYGLLSTFDCQVYIGVLKMKKSMIALAVAVTAMPAVSFAQELPPIFDPTETVTTIIGYIGPVVAIGSAVLGVVLAVKSFGWIKTALGR